MKVIEGKVPGFSYLIAKGGCAFCSRADTFVLRISSLVAICEACSILTNWAWRQVEGVGLPGAAYSTEVRFVLLVIARERPDDPLNPFDLVMVGRKDEPDAYGMPGGKVEPGEKPEEAAVRELHEETGIVTWPAALETLYTAYSPRSSLGRTYLVRGYHGDVPRTGVNVEGQKVAWKLWPPGKHAKHLAGFYIGLGEAFMLRWRLQKQAAATTPLSLRLSRPAVDYLTIKNSPMPDANDEFGLAERRRTLEGFATVMTPEETAIVNVICHQHAQQAGELLVKKKPAAPPPPDEPPSEQISASDDSDEDAPEAQSEEGEEGGDAAPSETDAAAGFARPAPLLRRGP